MGDIQNYETIKKDEWDERIPLSYKEVTACFPVVRITCSKTVHLFARLSAFIVVSRATVQFVAGSHNTARNMKYFAFIYVLAERRLK